MTGTLRVRRSRGALSGLLLLLLGIWGALIPLVGPYFHFAYMPDKAWDFTAARFWLEQLPGLAVVVGGVIVLISAHRLMGLFGAWLAAAGGAWFAVDTLVGGHWSWLQAAGTPAGGTLRAVLEQVSFFSGLGVVIAALAGVAMGRLSLVAVSDVKARRAVAEQPAAAAKPTAATEDSDPVQALPRRVRLGSPVVRRKTATADQARAPGSASLSS